MNSLEKHTNDFNKNGYTIVRGLLDKNEIDELTLGINKAFEEKEDGFGPFVRMKMIERGIHFEQLIDRSPIVDIAEKLLGANCHMLTMHALKTPKNASFDSWHVDEEVIFPLPENVEWDDRIDMPVFIVTCMIYLVDILIKNSEGDQVY